MTRGQQVLLSAVQVAFAATGLPPSVRKLCEMTGSKSTSEVARRIKALEKDGLVTRNRRGQVLPVGICPCCGAILSGG